MSAADDSPAALGAVRSVERALQIVELVDEHGALSLEHLHCLTGLPKSTLSRLLRTLVGQGWLYRGLCDRFYRLSYRRMRGNQKAAGTQRMIEAAKSTLMDLSASTGLVADLSSFESTSLTILETAIPRKLSDRYPSNGLSVGERASLRHSAMGKACVGRLENAAFDQLLAEAPTLQQDVTDARRECLQQGFGVRTEGVWEYKAKLSFSIRAIALPVCHEGRVVGGIALHWPVDLGDVDTIAGRYLPQLAASVSEVENRLGMF